MNFSRAQAVKFAIIPSVAESAGRLVIILKGRHNAKTDCLGASSGRTMSISSPRRVSFRAYQSPLRYARGGVFLLDAVAVKL